MITVTPEAKEKIAEMCVENAMIGVRAFVHGTGCAGMSHSMTFVEEKEERDTDGTVCIHRPSCLSVYGWCHDTL